MDVTEIKEAEVGKAEVSIVEIKKNKLDVDTDGDKTELDVEVLFWACFCAVVQKSVLQC